MSVEIAVFSAIAYMLGAIGYIMTIIRCSERKMNDKLILALLGAVWPGWLIILGLAFILTKIEHRLRYGH